MTATYVSTNPVHRTPATNMRIAQEEIFGPVLTVIPFEDEEDGLEIANDSPSYGLTGYLWTPTSATHRVPLHDKLKPA